MTTTSGSDRAKPKTARAMNPLYIVVDAAAPASRANRRGAAQAGILRPKRTPRPAEPLRPLRRRRLGPRETINARARPVASSRPSATYPAPSKTQAPRCSSRNTEPSKTATTPSRPIKTERVKANNAVSRSFDAPLLPSRCLMNTRLEPIEQGSIKPIKPSPAGMATSPMKLSSIIARRL